jgi:outer membrane lipase/esterase
LVVIWAGANDYQNRAATTPSAVLLSQVVGNLGTATGTMIARGARNLLVPNLPDLGRTPGATALGAATASGLSSLVQLHNNALVGAMNTLGNSTGARIIVMDTYGLFNDVLANASRYGIANTTVPCITPAGATPACTTAAAAQGTLFFDPIHPSATAHTVLAQFANSTIDQDSNGARTAAVTSHLAPLALDAVRQGVGDRLRVLRVSNTRERSTLPTGAYGAINYGTGDRDVTAGVMGYDYDLRSYTVGYDAVLGNSFVLGGSLTYVTGEAELAANRGEFEIESKAFAAYIGFRNGGFWVDLSGAGSWENYDLERNTFFAPRPLANANPDGNSFYGALDVGLRLGGDEGWSLSPFAGLRYLDGDIDSYAETDAEMLNLSVTEQNNSGVIGNVGVEAAGAFTSGGMAITPHVRVAYESALEDFDHAIAITSRVGQTRALSGGTGADHWLLVGAGLNVQPGASLSFSLDYQGTLDRSDGKDHAVVGRVVFSF